MEQRGFALVESMIAVVIFAISLVALVNYSQYIILNFNQLYQGSSAIRALQSTLEKNTILEGAIYTGKSPSIASNLRYPEWDIQTSRIPRAGNCIEFVASVTIKQQQLSLNRWYCSIGEHNVSSVSF